MVPLQIELPEHFLDEEVRCGYTVTRQMKELWAVELDLLVQVQKICEKHDIEYFADGGTLLGAVRHNGFIPWDDDIDIKMDRKNYEKFCEIAKKELKEPYFFQTEETDPSSIFGCLKIRNSNTIMRVEKQIRRGFSYNQGIWIDIFAYDNIPDSEIEFKKFQKKLVKIKKLAHKFRNFSHFDTDENKLHIKKRIFAFFVKTLKIKNFFYYKLEKVAQMYNNQNTERFSAIFFKPERTKGFEKKSYFEKKLFLNFEFLKLPVPLDYDSVLTENYGNWKEFVVGSSLHGETVFNTDVSYKTVLIKDENND